MSNHRKIKAKRRLAKKSNRKKKVQGVGPHFEMAKRLEGLIHEIGWELPGTPGIHFSWIQELIELNRTAWSQLCDVERREKNFIVILRRLLEKRQALLATS